MRQYAKILIGLLIILIFSFLFPYLFLLNFGKINSSSFIIASLLFSFLSLPLILVIDIIFSKMYKEKDIKNVSEEKLEGKILNKISKIKKYEAPLFLLPINMGFYLIAKALESESPSCVLEVLIKGKAQSISVSTDVYNSLSIGENIKVLEVTEKEVISLSYFEMLLLNIYKNSVEEYRVRYCLI